MPNWCNNVLTIEGKNAVAIAHLAAEFERIARKEKAEDCGQLFFDSGESYLFDIAPAEGDGELSDNSVCVIYCTRWSPNVQDMLTIARERGFNFSLEYEEFGNQIFGEVQFASESNLTLVRYLTSEDFDRVEATEDDMYLLDGEKYECDTEAYEKLLESKLFEQLRQTY